VIVRVTDTHALLWYLSDNPRLSEAALACFVEAEAGRAAILVPSIVLVEAVYLFEKQRIPQELIDGILIRIGEGPSYQLVPLDLSVVHALRSIDRRAGRPYTLPGRTEMATEVFREGAEKWRS
jgi:PIN domain nuclease of toxin-antitoxin system